MEKLLNNISSKSIHVVVLLAILSSFYFIGLGHNNLFDWDEVNFAECAREMIESDNYLQVQINYEPFYEKPPLFVWLQATSMKIFGINEFAARFPNALFGFVTLLTVFLIGKKYKDARFGLMWALLYFGSFLPHIYFKSGIIDPVFNLFIFLSVYFLIRTINDKQNKFAILAGIFSGLSVITKGPVGFLIFFLAFLVYIISRKFKDFPKLKFILLFTISIIFSISIWFGVEILVNGFEFIKQFVIYQVELFIKPVAGHEQPFYYHFVVVLIGCFPISILALPAFNPKYEHNSMDFRRWMIILFWVVMILFTIVKTKIIHYSSMAYLPLSFLATYYLYKVIDKGRIIKLIAILFLFFGTIISGLLTAVPLLAYNKEKLYDKIQDQFALDNLKQVIPWNNYEYLVGILLFVFIIIGFILLLRRKILSSIFISSLSMGIVLLLFLYFVVPKIERFSQGAAIDFFKKNNNNNAYITTAGFKSYAHYFYGELDYENSKESRDSHWLFHGNNDKPVYIITKTTYPDFSDNEIELYMTTGGFNIYIRPPKE